MVQTVGNALRGVPPAPERHGRYSPQGDGGIVTLLANFVTHKYGRKMADSEPRRAKLEWEMAELPFQMVKFVRVFQSILMVVVCT